MGADKRGLGGNALVCSTNEIDLKADFFCFSLEENFQQERNNQKAGIEKKRKKKRMRIITGGGTGCRRRTCNSNKSIQRIDRRAPNTRGEDVHIKTLRKKSLERIYM